MQTESVANYEVAFPFTVAFCASKIPIDSISLLLPGAIISLDLRTAFHVAFRRVHAPARSELTLNFLS